MDSRIISCTCGVYGVRTQNGTIINTKPLGIIRHQKKKPVVGDFVVLDEQNMIKEIKPRTNSLIRPMIANIDYGIIITSLVNPEYSSLLLDKFLTMLNIYRIKPMIILSKIDICEDKEKAESIKRQYENIGIPTFIYSKKTKYGLDEILNAIENKTVAFMGQTGVGKSSLINLIAPEYQRKIGEYSVSLGRGKHETKEVILLPYEHGYIADTPGFSSLELNCYKEELALYFPGFSKYTNSCRFPSCLHTNEKDCGVREALEKKELNEENYQNYLYLSKDLMFRKDRFKK